MRRAGLIFFLSLVCYLFLISPLPGSCRQEFPTKMATVGGIRDAPDQNSLEAEQLARFAVDEHNKKENSLLEFARLVKAKEQVVAGTMHHLTVEVIEAGKKKIYEAKVWVKAWMNFKELQEFKPVEGCSSTPSNASA